ncbi:DUF6029 family protein [Gracilimonas mengyeensis]|uniref:Uncharacterized protein n=1 Tax=Gracilimonas mengyeensis TaxID=1302730 RepID=A0A521F931_9BACT|nr:DUF6029 family protein [Gracilimonas mengyeensis]SMO92564.1 hypothetical protein SAMN06265219_11612 [Gracilimonas mengyeensis]
MKWAVIAIVFGLIAWNSSSAWAQLYGTNLFEFQYGNLPFEGNTDLTTSYDRLNLFYDQENISVYGRFESFMTPYNDRNYFSMTQKRLQYQDESFNIRIGNFYETLGRGLLLRSYEIPGSVYEDDFYRTRYAFNRDQEGVAIGYSNDWAEVTALRARPLYNPLPPNFKPDSARRPDLIEAVESNFNLTDDLSFGGTFMRSHSDGESIYREFASLMYNYNTPFNLQLYGEYAFDTDFALFQFREEDSYALYSGLNYFYESFGVSVEYKNYHNFRLGAGYNDPPSLIKEHTYPVLNRSTHVLQTRDESGFQFEVFYTFEGGHSLTANYTRAVNDISQAYQFREYFLEGTYLLNDFLSFKSFLDYATDELQGEEHRVSGGLIVDKSFNYEWNLTVDLQFQQFDRSFNPDKIRNYYGSASVGFPPDLTISAVFEASNDLNLTDNPNTLEIEGDTRFWLGGNLRYKINRSHTLDLFGGKRRGGTACTSGICYEILDFEGVEMRFTTRF